MTAIKPQLVLKPIYHFLKGTILRGPAKRWWIHRRARQMDQAYLEQITATTTQEPAAAPRASPASTRPPSSLNRILFIGDCMWEQDQLFPAIRKICDLDVLNLHPFLGGSSDPAQAVVSAIATHAATATKDPDLILFYARPSILSEEAFCAIRERWSCPLFGMNLDDRVEFFPYGIFKSGNDNYARWVRNFDLNLTSSITAMDWYDERGANARYLPQGFHPDPRFLVPPKETEFAHRFTFVGSWKPERGQLIRHLGEYRIKPELFGKGWPDGQWVEDPARIFRSSQINLGIGYALASGRIANAKGRDIECPATGACYLTTYHWELASMFEIGKEVLCYRNLEELVELFTYYSKRPDACLSIGQAAHRRAHREHTWENRLRTLFRDLGFTPRRN